MPRYFFHLKDGSTHMDNDGVELSGHDEARTQAIVNSGEVLRDLGAKFWTSDEWRLWVTDESGETVCALRFSAE